jgi:excisionase family DNA binding protein
MPRAHRIPANERIALDLPEAAAALSISLGTLLTLIDDGEVPVTRVHGMKRIMLDDLRTYCLQNRDPMPLPMVRKGRIA